MKAYKTEINPTEAQKDQIVKTFGACRWVYNAYIEANKKSHESGGKFISGYTFTKYLNNEFREEHPEMSWLREVSSKALKKSVWNAEVAFKRFFKAKKGFPKFKSKRDSRQSYYLISGFGIIKAERHRIFLPCLKWVRLKEFGYIPTGQIIRSVTVSSEAGRYYVSALVEDQKESTRPELINDGIGVDLGLKNFAVTSYGEVFGNVNKTEHVKKAERRVVKEQRKLSRKIEKGEKTERRVNLKKQIEKLRKAHQRVKAMRLDFIRKVAVALVRIKPKFMVLEDLNVRGMMKNRHLSKAIQGQNFYQFREILVRMCQAAGIPFILADRFFPSSKLCSKCGEKHVGLKLSDRLFVCPVCGYEIDRDLNAAINLRNYGAHESEIVLSTVG